MAYQEPNSWKRFLARGRTSKYFKIIFAMHKSAFSCSHAQLKRLKVRLENNQSIVNGRSASVWGLERALRATLVL